MFIFGGILCYDKFFKGTEEPTTDSNVVDVEEIEVPNFVNSSYDMVAQNPVQNTRFKITSVMEYSNEVEKGYIISQSVEAGKIVPAGTEITFVVSKGPEYVTIPPVKGTTLDYAKQTLEAAGFVVQVITKENTGGNTEGVVAEVTPAEGTSKVKGSEVYIQVWGPPPSTEPETESTTEENPFYNPFF